MNTHYAVDNATLCYDLQAHGIKEPVYRGFHWETKLGGEHIRRTQVGDTTFALRVWACGTGYNWTFGRI